MERMTIFFSAENREPLKQPIAGSRNHKLTAQRYEFGQNGGDLKMLWRIELRWLPGDPGRGCRAFGSECLYNTSKSPSK